MGRRDGFGEYSRCRGRGGLSQLADREYEEGTDSGSEAIWAAASEVALEQRADVSHDISLYFYRYQGDPKLVYVDARGVVEPTRLVLSALGITGERKKRYKGDDKSCFCCFLVSV